jgi:hypothetical protein
MKYPEIEVDLIGEDGNAFAILGRVRSAMIKAGLEDVEIEKFMDEATDGDYNHLLVTTMNWVNVV